MNYISVYLSAMLSLVAATTNDSTTYISNNLRKNTNIRYLRGEEDVACISQDDCQAQSQEMGFEFFYTGVYPTKGCYSKGTNAFFSIGSEDEMSIPYLSGSKQRIWCNPTSIPIQFEEKSSLSEEEERDACTTAESCKAKALEVGVDVDLYFYNNEFETRGCYTKTSPTSGITKAFWSLGTEEEMSTSDLSAPLLERLWCDDKDLSENSLDADTAYPTPAVVYTNSPVKPTNKPTMPSKTKAPSTPPTKEPTNEPTKKPTDVVDTDGTQPPPSSSNPTKSPATEAPSYYPTVDSFEFNCPAPDFVGCTAVDLSDPQDECTTVGEPCPGSADVPIYCCRDACPRNYCTAKEAQPDASFAKASASTTTNSGGTTFAFSFATAVLGLVVMSFNF